MFRPLWLLMRSARIGGSSALSLYSKPFAAGNKSLVDLMGLLFVWRGLKGLWPSWSTPLESFARSAFSSPGSKRVLSGCVSCRVKGLWSSAATKISSYIINPNSSEAITGAIVATIDRMQLGDVRSHLEPDVKGTDKLTATVVHGVQCLHNSAAIFVKHK